MVNAPIALKRSGDGSVLGFAEVTSITVTSINVTSLIVSGKDLVTIITENAGTGLGGSYNPTSLSLTSLSSVSFSGTTVSSTFVSTSSLYAQSGTVVFASALSLTANSINVTALNITSLNVPLLSSLSVTSNNILAASATIAVLTGTSFSFLTASGTSLTALGINLPSLSSNALVITDANDNLVSYNLSAYSITFSGGETYQRITITNSVVTPQSNIIHSISRANLANDYDDPGYLYFANVIYKTSGSFDIVVRCVDIGFDDTTELPPTETINFTYLVL